MALVLPPELLREKARVRGALLSVLEVCAAALVSGRNVLIIDDGIEQGVAIAEAIIGTACESGACLGSLMLSERSSKLLSIEEVVQEPLREDFWLLVRGADSSATARVANYSRPGRLDYGWRAILVSRGPLSRVISETDARTRRGFACVDLAA